MLRDPVLGGPFLGSMVIAAVIPGEVKHAIYRVRFQSSFTLVFLVDAGMIRITFASQRDRFRTMTILLDTKCLDRKMLSSALDSNRSVSSWTSTSDSFPCSPVC